MATGNVRNRVRSSSWGNRPNVGVEEGFIVLNLL